LDNDFRELFSLAGKVAIVTGATSGIGLATAEMLASAGAEVFAFGLPGEKPEKFWAQRVRDAGSVIGVSCDVTDEAQLEAAVAMVVASAGRIDVVVCNAGINVDESDPADGSELLDAMFALHVRSPLRTSALTLPVMAAGGGGSFIVMSSLAGLRGNSRIGLYGITKAANAQLARNIAVQWGAQNIRANAIAPGVIDTDFAKPLTADAATAERRLAKTPLGRFGHPANVAGTVLWLASEAGSFTSGQTIVVDGGTLIQD